MPFDKIYFLLVEQHLPMGFCKSHMPRHNLTVILEDEDGEKYDVNYIVEKTALSAGWKLFTTAQNLVEGDVVIFQLVEPSRFKVIFPFLCHREIISLFGLDL